MAPRLQARVQVTNGGTTFGSPGSEVVEGAGTFDSLSPVPVRGDGLDEVRISFSVTKTLDPAPNTAEVTLWNLSQERIDQICGTVRKRIAFSPEEKLQLEQAGASSTPIEQVYDNAGIAAIRLSWGYEAGALSVGFIGGSTNITEETDGRDSRLVIKAEDGGPFLGAGRLKRYYRGGTDTVVIIRDLVQSCGLTVDEDRLRFAMQQSLISRGIAVGDLTQLTGYNAATTPAADQIRAVMDSLQIRWSVQDGEFLVLDGTSTLAGFEPLVLSAADFTLFGSPKRLEAQQLEARTWANAEARPGRKVIVDALDLETNYRIDTMKTTGDTYSGGETVLTLDALQVIPGIV